MNAILAEGTGLPFAGAGWVVLLLGLAVTAIWLRYLYR